MHMGLQGLQTRPLWNETYKQPVSHMERQRLFLFFGGLRA